jgi:hypothetical protein
MGRIQQQEGSVGMLGVLVNIEPISSEFQTKVLSVPWRLSDVTLGICSFIYKRRHINKYNMYTLLQCTLKIQQQHFLLLSAMPSIVRLGDHRVRKLSSSASSGVTANSMQLAQRGRYREKMPTVFLLYWPARPSRIVDLVLFASSESSR